MKNKNNKPIRLIILSIALLFAFFSIGISSWYILTVNTASKNYDDNTTKGDTVNVTLRYKAYIGLTKTQVGTTTYVYPNDGTYFNGTESSTAKDESLNLETLKTNLTNIGSTNLVNTLNSLYITAKSSSSATATLSANKYYEEVTINETDANIKSIVLDVKTKIVINYQNTGCVSTVDSYQMTSGEYRVYYEKFVYNRASEVFNKDNPATFTIKKGSTLSSTSLIKNCKFDEQNEYYLNCFYKSDASGNVTSTYFDINQPITNDISLYAVFNKKEDTMGYNLLTEKINSNTSTIKIAASSLADYDITNDFTYFSPLKSISLGYNNLETIIPTNATVNFCLNDLSVYKYGSGSYKIIEPDKNSLQYCVVLQSDLIINGTLTIGSCFGDTNNTSVQGMINKEHVCLDLNGHNIYVNSGGKLISYGLIKNSNSVKGEIIVKGGYIQSLIVFRDYKGGSSTLNLYGDHVMPIVLYSLPYLRCNLKVLYSNNTFGTFSCLFRFKSTSYFDPANAYLNFVGPDSNYFFHADCLNADQESYISLETYILGDDVEITSDEVNNCTLYRNKWSIYNVNARIESIVMNVGDTVDTSTVNFPISPFFDLNVIDSNLYFSQRLQMYPGSSLYANENSNICFEYNSSSSLAAQLSVCGDYFQIHTPDKLNSKINSIYSSGSIYTYNKTLIESKNFWLYYGQPKVNIFGTTWFKKGNSASYQYRIIGEYNCSSFGYYTSDISDGKSFTINKNNAGNVFDDICNNNIYLDTYGYDFLCGFYGTGHLKGYGLALITNDIVILKNNTSTNDYSKTQIGTFNRKTGLFQLGSSNQYYFINVGETFSYSDYSVSINKCTYDENSHVITDDSGSSYVYFYECFYKVSGVSNNVYTVSTTRISSSVTSVNVTYDSEYEAWIKTS